MPKMHVVSVVNGEETEFLCEPSERLMDVLRNQLQVSLFRWYAWQKVCPISFEVVDRIAIRPAGVIREVGMVLHRQAIGA